MSYRTPLAKARGLGSAKTGTQNWWRQRITAIAMIPLSVWFVCAVISLGSVEHQQIVKWIGEPWNATLLISFIVAGFYHMLLGIEVILEDYVHNEWIKIGSILFTKILVAFFALASLYATIRIAFVG